MTPPRQSNAPSDEPLSDVWRSALWILEALPPSRRIGSTIAPLRQRKLTEYLHGVVSARGPSGAALLAHVADDTPFLPALMWWVHLQGVEDDVLLQLDSLQISAANTLLGIAGARSGVHTILVTFASKRAMSRDTDFSETEIRMAKLRRIVGR